MTQRFFTLQEVAKQLRVSERSIFRYIKNKQLTGSKQGKWRFTEQDIKKFLDKGRKDKKYGN